MPQFTPQLLLAVLAVLFIGVSKAGFGGGLGLLTTPVAVLAFGPRDAIGILLPLLCAGDAFSLWHYWRKWEARNLKYLLPGVVVGIMAGVQLIGRFSPRQLNIAIGTIAVAFVAFQMGKERIFRGKAAFTPNHRVGQPLGVASGITSTFAHGAGPVVAMFLIPQRMPKEIFVGTNVLIFTFINWLKMPFFCIDRTQLDWPLFAPVALVNRHTFFTSLALLPLIPVGVWLGVWLNRRFSESGFVKFIYAALLLTGLELIFGFSRWLR